MSLGALFTAFRVTEAIEVNLINLMISYTRFTRGYGGLRLHAHNFHVTVASEPERIGVFLTRSCVHVTDISCGVVYEATLASLVLFRSYRYVAKSENENIYFL